MIVSFILCVLFSLIAAITEPPKPHGCERLTQADAERMLGTAARVSEDRIEQKENTRIAKCTYAALSNAESNAPAVNLYFMFEESLTDEQARRTFAEIRESNKTHRGFELWPGVGDEALVHSERPNFHFVMARKGRYSVRVKINTAAETTSLNEVKSFVARLIERL